MNKNTIKKLKLLSSKRNGVLDDNGLRPVCSSRWVEAHKRNSDNPFEVVCRQCAPIIASMGWIPK